MADDPFASATAFKSKTAAPPGMVCDGDVCYFPDAEEAEEPPPLLGDAPEKRMEPAKRDFPLPGLLKDVVDLVDSDGRPVPKDVVLGLADKVVGCVRRKSARLRLG